MKLNRMSDLALRLMMLLAQSDRPLSVEAAANRLRVSKSQTMKLVARLARAGLLRTTRGRGGGVALGRSADEVSVGDVVRVIESDLAVVECLREGPCDCVFLPRCALMRAMRSASDLFLGHLDGFTLADVASRSQTPEPTPARA